MDWMINDADKVIVNTFNNYISNNFEFLISQKICIWGASVRGTILGICLTNAGIKNFFYTDNDTKKWNNQINDFKIIKPEYEKLKDSYILIPIEYSSDVINQLNSMNLNNYYCLEINKDELLMDEIEAISRDDILIFGDGTLDIASIGNKVDYSLKEIIYNKVKKIKIISLDCVSIVIINYILDYLKNRNRYPKKIFYLSSYETFTEYHHILPRTQHVNLISKLLEANYSIELESKYIKSIEYTKNIRLEADFSPRRTYNKKNNIREIQKEYLLKSTLLPLKNDYVEIVELKKMIDFCEKYDIKFTLIQLPINYVYGEKLFPDFFNKAVSEKNLFIENIIQSYRGKYYNLSFILNDDCFIKGATINDSITFDGKIKLADKILNIIDENV